MTMYKAAPPATSQGSEQPATIGFPKSILSVVRDEYYGQDPQHPVIELTVRDGKTGKATLLPENLKGHAFIIGPVGSIASPPVSKPSTSTNLPVGVPETVLPAADGWTTLLNGDGMVYRLDFHTTPVTPYPTEPGQPCPFKHEPGKAWLTTRLVKPPSFYADKITYATIPKTTESGALNQETEQTVRNRWSLKFWGMGLFRISLVLGVCKQINTGFQPIQFIGDKHSRLLATNDASRPFEIDPCSLKTIAPVGFIKHWKPLVNAPLQPKWILPAYITSAHPCFDSKTGEFFISNVQQSLKTTLQLPLKFHYEGMTGFWKELLDEVAEFCARIYEWGLSALDRIGLLGKGALYVVQWRGGVDGQGDAQLKQWQVVLPNGKPIKIQQSSHTMGITRRYLVLADTAFKITLEDMIPSALLRPLQRWLDKVRENPKPGIDQRLKKIINEWLEWRLFHLTTPQSPDTYVYIIHRDQFSTVPPGGSVVAQKVKVEGEFTHFLTEYDDESTEGHIILHPGMNYATDAAQFIHPCDDSAYRNPDIQKEVRPLAGMWTAGMDVNGPAVVAIDPRSGQAKKYDLNLLEAIKSTLFVGLYAYRDDMPTEQYEDIYWMGGGGWAPMLTEFMYSLYSNHQYRRISAAEMLEVLKRGVPMILSRAHVDRQQLINFIRLGDEPAEPVLTIQDQYEFPTGYFGSSPQFIPHDGSTGSRDGYIVCTVIHSNDLLSYSQDEDLHTNNGTKPSDWSNNSELWIFDANDLKQGPLYKLSHPWLNFTLTLHTTWLREIVPAPASNYQIREDFKEAVQQAVASHRGRVGEQIQDLFEKVYKLYGTD
jgi:hypothetical protein